MVRVLFSLIFASLFVFGCGDDDDDNAGNVGTEIDETTDSAGTDVLDTDTGEDTSSSIKDTGENEDTGKDTGEETVEEDLPSVCGGYDWDKETYDYGKDYPVGPYGFKGSWCWTWSGDYGWGTWSENGDTIHDICLPNQDDEMRCLNEYYRKPDLDVLFVAFDARDCPVCGIAADTREEFRTYLADRGWNAEFFDIQEGSLAGSKPSIVDAINWKEDHDLTEDVLYDADQIWREKAFLDKWPGDKRQGFPSFLMINPKNMRVWDEFEGWSMPEDLEMLAGQIVGRIEALYLADRDTGEVDTGTVEDTDTETAESTDAVDTELDTAV